MTLRQRSIQQTVNNSSRLSTQNFDGCTVPKHHKSNAPGTRKVYVTEDFRLICWKEVGGKKAKVNSIQSYRDIKTTTKALCRKHLLRAKPKPEHCFIKARTRDLDLEAENEAQRDLGSRCYMLAHNLEIIKV